MQTGLLARCISIRSAPQCVSNSWAMWTPDGVFLLPFETMHQQENINKCLPPSTFNPPSSSSSSFHHPPSPSPSAESHSLTCETLPGRQEHVFGIKLLNALSNKIYSLIGSFPIYILPFCLGAGLAKCQTDVSSGGKVYEPQPGGESEPHGEKESGLVDIQGKTNSLTSKSWQTCWWVLWFLCFSPRCL